MLFRKGCEKSVNNMIRWQWCNYVSFYSVEKNETIKIKITLFIS